MQVFLRFFARIVKPTAKTTHSSRLDDGLVDFGALFRRCCPSLSGWTITGIKGKVSTSCLPIYDKLRREVRPLRCRLRCRLFTDGLWPSVTMQCDDSVVFFPSGKYADPKHLGSVEKCRGGGKSARGAVQRIALLPPACVRYAHCNWG